MNRKKLLFICVCLISISQLHGQSVTVIERNEAFEVSEKPKEFFYIEKEFPLPDDRRLATFEGLCANNQKSNLETLFYDFQKTANEMGANAFFIENFSSSTDTIFVTVSIYHLTEKELDATMSGGSCACNKVIYKYITS